MTRTQAKAVNINDVARRAAVSYQTVSRVINNHPAVAPGTRTRVEEAIRALGYRPNLAARNLAARRSFLLGVVSFGVTHYGPAQMLSSLELAARQRGYRLSTVSVDDLSLEEIGRAIADLRGQQVAGILLITPLLQIGSAHVEALCEDVPCLLIDAEPKAGRRVVAIDQFVGGRLAAQHLTSLGHRAVALLGGPGTWYDAMQRRAGWLSALHQMGLSPVWEAEGDWTAAGGYNLTRQLLDGGRPFTALLAGNDQMALGAIRALKEGGRRLPQDVSLVGFDDVEGAAFYDPPLTTVRQDFRTLGQNGLADLLRLIEREDGDAGVASPTLLPTLVVRTSTAPPLTAQGDLP